MGPEIKPKITQSDIHRAFVKYIRDCGETLIKNAESIVGDEKGLNSIHISISMDKVDGCDGISVTKDILPETCTDRESDYANYI